MPTYEYRCKACAHELEVVQAFSDDPLTECPECGGDLRKLFGSVGIAFKGSGFYKNDSRSSAGKSDKSDKVPVSTAEATGSADSKTDSKTESKSESKTEPKGDTKPDKKADVKSSSTPSTKQPASA